VDQSVPSNGAATIGFGSDARNFSIRAPDLERET